MMVPMEALKIEAKYDTPRVVLDPGNGTFEVSGRSIPEDADEFYQPMLTWLEKYSKESSPSTDFVFKLDYLNTASSRCIQNVLLLLKSIKGVSIQWLYKEDDQDMEDAGNDFAELIEFPIVLKSY
jgi:hypothetical protein